jgi:excisionase family DNA binding protein
MSPMLTVAEVAKRLSVSRNTVYQLVQRGDLVAHRVGLGRGAVRVTPEELDAFLARSRQAPPPPVAQKRRSARLPHLGL